MAGITDAIRIMLTDDLYVYVEKDGECRDALLWLDCRPQKQGKHYVCAFCPPGEQEDFASREALRRSHMFDPLAEWMQTLRSSNWLLLFETCPGGSTWARLETNTPPEPQPHLVARLPVHVADSACDARAG